MFRSRGNCHMSNTTCKSFDSKECTDCSDQPCKSIYLRPPPPRLPRNFRWSGCYVVPDLNMNVPFTWHGNNGNIQMIAGNINYPIWFTNFIINNCLYTYTYKWPGLTPQFLPGCENCKPLPFPFSIDDLNTLFATSSYVGPEILESEGFCSGCAPGRISKLEQGNKFLYVNHFRLSVVLQLQNPGSGAYLRLPITSADIYVDRNDSTTFWIAKSL